MLAHLGLPPGVGLETTATAGAGNDCTASGDSGPNSAVTLHVASAIPAGMAFHLAADGSGGTDVTLV